MRIGIYDPYLDTLGGGERYMLTLASCLGEIHNVSVFWNDKNILQEAEEKLGINLKKVQIVQNIFEESFVSKYLLLQDFDAIFFLSDGSIPSLFSKRNFLLFQFPRISQSPPGITDRIKLAFITKILYNSIFVMKSYKDYFGRSEEVLYPPVELLERVDQSEKDNIIMSVGRFTTGMNMKKQEFLIRAFCNSVIKKNKGWKLVLVGSVLPSDRDYLSKLSRMASGSQIEIIENPSYALLQKYFKKAKIYWHAAGQGEDLGRHPERAEHFGIAIVEAMSAGCVPVVFGGGGVDEIIENNKSGFFFQTEKELLETTQKLIDDPRFLIALSQAAIERAKRFSVNNFRTSLQKLLQ